MFYLPAARSVRKFNGMRPLLPRRLPPVLVRFRTVVFRLLMPANTWIEDRDPTGTRRLGHRSGVFSEGIPGNRYLDTSGRVNQAFGHLYEGTDAPTGFATDRGSWSFRLRAIDVCNGNQQVAVSPTLVVNWL
jgi:hypothetical protein